MFIPLHDTNPLKRIDYQYVTVALIVLNVAIYVIFLSGWVIPLDEEDTAAFAVVPAKLMGASLADATSIVPGVFPFPERFTLVSYMFLHGDFAHVGINSLWLLVFGPPVAQRLGTLEFLIFFFLCGIAAAGVHLAWNWGSIVPVVGASGAISGLMGASIRLLYGRRDSYFAETPRLAPLLSRPVLMVSAAWAVANVIAGVLRIGVTEEYALVAWQAHLGGYFAGLLAIGPFDRFGRGPIPAG